MTERNLKELKKKGIKLNEIKKYVPYSERIISENDENIENSLFSDKKDDLNGLYKLTHKVYNDVSSYPEVDDLNLLFKSVYIHDNVAMDFLETLFLENKHVDGKLSNKVFEFLNNTVKALSLNESEKRFSIARLFGKNKN